MAMNVDLNQVRRVAGFRSDDALVLSLYVAVPPEPDAMRDPQAVFRSLLKPVRELADDKDLDRAQKTSLRADLDRVLDRAPHAVDLRGRALAIFACDHDGFYEEIELPRRVRDRAHVDATPYVRPLLAVLDESHRYVVAVLDRERAWLYEFFMGELQDEATVRGRALRNANYAGWSGYNEHSVHNKAEELARRHYRETADKVDELVSAAGAELVVVGGHQETVAEFLGFLSRSARSRLAGTFVIDTSTMSPTQVRERADEVVDAYERDEERRLVAETLEKVAARGFGAAGLEWCLAAANEHAVQLLLVQDDEQAPGRVCGNCGWLGLDGDECPVCGQATRKTVDVIDELAAKVIDTGGQVEHVYADTDLASHLVAAGLRFPVARPG